MENTENVVLTNMCMVYKGDEILVENRTNKKWPGVTFPGGHVDKNESFADSTIREVFEETGLKISNLELYGIKQFSEKSGKYRYIVLFYKTSTFEGKLKSSIEGEVFWIKRKDLEKYQLAEGFENMIKVFENPTLSEVYCYYEGDDWKESLK